MRTRMQRALGVLAAVVVAGCSVLSTNAGPGGDLPPLGISNGTTLQVTLVVNDQVVGVYQPGAGTDRVSAPLPPLPWTVEARTVNGRVLTRMNVAPGQVFESISPDGAQVESGALGRVDLSCGRLDLWAGFAEPLGPAPGPGTLGDCQP